MHFLANLRKGLSSSDFSDAAEIYKRQNPGIKLEKILTYVDEKKDREGSDRQREILEDIKEIARKRGSLGERDLWIPSLKLYSFFIEKLRLLFL